jgi:hypothetical protein
MHKSSRVLPYIQNSSEFFEFKGKTIRWINERLKDEVLGLNDETMGSIMTLISFEVRYLLIAPMIWGSMANIGSLRRRVGMFQSASSTWTALNASSTFEEVLRRGKISDASNSKFYCKQTHFPS